MNDKRRSVFIVGGELVRLKYSRVGGVVGVQMIRHVRVMWVCLREHD